MMPREPRKKRRASHTSHRHHQPNEARLGSRDAPLFRLTLGLVLWLQLDADWLGLITPVWCVLHDMSYRRNRYFVKFKG